MKTLEKTYNHQNVEKRIYQFWEKSGYFKPKARGQKKPFTIIMPPPNANGSLHIGHAVFVTLEDLMIRYNRMLGKPTLWLPGFDHAGFETQVVYEKKLEKEGKNRFKIPREELYRQMYEFTVANKKFAKNQLKHLGASADWSRERFTLEPDLVEKVQETFIDMHKAGLIYRGNRLVNWCAKHQTGLSDVETKTQTQKDALYYIKYGPITLATVRPETVFGDTAVAVHPLDKRYKKYIGKEIETVSLLGPRKLKVIGDNSVDPKFGTGAVKITPANDPADFEIWQAHKNEIPGPVEVIDQFGKLNLFTHFGENLKTKKYHGLKIKEARKLASEELEKLGLIEKINTNYEHNITTCYKCGNVLEPRLLPQWYVDIKPLAAPAIRAVEEGKIKILPAHYKKVYLHWMRNIRDWNISRQIVWGIQIPAWFCLSCNDIKIKPKIKSNWYIVRHGETDWNKEKRWQGHKDIPLNETGRKQAQEALQQLKGKKIDLIISSDLGRCRETAEIIAKELGVKIIYDEGLRERFGGIFQGLTLEEAKLKLNNKSATSWRELWKTSADQFTGIEAFESFEERVWGAFNRHKKENQLKNIVIVSHGGAIRSITRSLKNLSHEQISALEIKNAQLIELSIAEKKCKCGSDLVEQDQDVFDTWFSSGQWPYLALGYPNSKDYKTFYPTDVMETGWDILFFWVARMIMFGLWRTGKAPFHTVYLHGLVRDKDRQKMSKSKGNVIDPLGVAELYSSDAVRMALTFGTGVGKDAIISEEKIRGFRNFANKLWNASRFILMNFDENVGELNPKDLTFTKNDKWILGELNKTTKKVTSDIEKYNFHHAAEEIYHFFWHKFCDKTIEDTKARLSSNDVLAKKTAQYVLYTVLRDSLKLLHPFMPFITEEIWQHIKTKSDSDLIVAPWPKL